MRSRSSFIGLVVVAFTSAMSGMASAAVLYDDFNGTSLDPTKWTALAGGFSLPTVANSKVTATYPQAGESVQQIVPGDTVYFKIGDAPAGYNVFGTGNSSNTGGIGIRNDQAGYGYYQFVVWQGANIYHGPDIGALSAGDVFKLAWNIDGSASAYKNGVLCGFTNTISVPSGQDIEFGGGDFLSLDAISVNTPLSVPEPSTLVLVGTSMFGLLAYAWRRRR